MIEKEYVAIKERNYKLVVSDLLESLEEDSEQREKQIRELIDLFLDWEMSYKVRAIFSEIFEQEWFGKNKYHKYDVPEHTKEALRIYRGFDFVPDKIRKVFLEKIEGLTKDVLIQLAIIFHDAGKKMVFDLTLSDDWTIEDISVPSDWLWEEDSENVTYWHMWHVFQIKSEMNDYIKKITLNT